MKSPAVLAAEAAASRAADKYVTRNGRPVASPKQVIAEKIELALAGGDTPQEIVTLYLYIKDHYMKRAKAGAQNGSQAIDALASLTSMSRAQLQDAARRFGK